MFVETPVTGSIETKYFTSFVLSRNNPYNVFNELQYSMFIILLLYKGLYIIESFETSMEYKLIVGLLLGKMKTPLFSL